MLVFSVVVITVTGVTFWVLYDAAIDQQRLRLVETAQSHARTIEAIYRHELEFEKATTARSDHGGPFDATIAQIRDAHARFAGFGATGEFTLATLRDDQIVFLLSHRHLDLNHPEPVPLSSNLAEPMRRALAGEGGTIVGLDYRGEKVLAAYEALDDLGVGIVAKIDLKEVHAPFIRAGLLAVFSAFLLITVGSILVFRISNPIIHALHDNTLKLEEEIGERERMQLELERELGESTRLAELSHALIAPDISIDEISSLVLDCARGLTDSPGGCITSFDPECGICIGQTQAGSMDELCIEISNSGPNDGGCEARGIRAGMCSIGRDTRLPFFTNDASSFLGDRAVVDRHRIPERFLAVPAMVSDELVGQVTLAASTRDYGERDLTAVGRLAELFALAVMRHRAELAVRLAEEKYRNLFENANDSIFIVDPVEGRIVDANDNACQRLGYQRDEMLGMPMGDVEEPMDAALQTTIGDRLADRDAVVYEHLYRHRDGQAIPVEVSSRVVSFGERTVIQSLVRDISDRRMAEESLRKARDLLEHRVAERTAELEEAHDRLRQSQKMEAIGRLAGGVAHDFNNLLTVINGYTKIALKRLGDGEAIRGGLETVRDAGLRAASLTNQLLAFSRKQVLKPELIDLNSVVSESHGILRRLIGEDLDLSLDLAEDLGVVRADPGQLHQVLINLAVNARDAMPKGGTLRIGTSVVALGEECARRNPQMQPGRYVMLAVADSGCGMDMSTLDRIFEPFFTTKDKGEGTGLGLSTVYGIVVQSGGCVEVESEPGRGTTFRIYLPHHDTGEPAREEYRAELDSAPGTETLLLVEDEAIVLEFARQALAAQGYKVLIAHTGEQALTAVDGYHGSIDLLVSDVVMPKMSGRELAERLLATHPALKVIFMSGHADDALDHHGVGFDAFNFIAKPFDAEELIAKVREVLDGDGGKRADA